MSQLLVNAYLLLNAHAVSQSKTTIIISVLLTLYIKCKFRIVVHFYISICLLPHAGEPFTPCVVIFKQNKLLDVFSHKICCSINVQYKHIGLYFFCNYTF